MQAALAGTDTHCATNSEIAWDYEAPGAGSPKRLRLRALKRGHSEASGWLVTAED